MAHMKCQDQEHYGGPDLCEKEAVGTDLYEVPLCQRHLAMTILAQQLCNANFRQTGRTYLIPPCALSNETN